MVAIEKIHEMFPELEEMEDQELKERTAAVWKDAMERGGWEDLTGVPFTLLVPDLEEDLVEHTRRVTRSAMAIADLRGDLRRDYVIAGGLLHDVGKAMEMTREGTGVAKSENGKLLRHPVSGAGLAMHHGLPDEIAHIIAAHSKEGEMVKRIPEAVLIFHCDFIDFEIMKAQRGL